MKKNYRKIPTAILDKVKRLKSDDFIVFGLLKAKTNDIQANKYRYLSIQIINGELNYEAGIIPDKKQGKYSKWNIEGREIKRKDLPKESFYNYIEAPNWGDSYNGTHTVALSGERYPIDYIPPQQIVLQIQLISHDENEFVFQILSSQVLNRNSDKCEERLLFDINLMQENVGMADIVESSIASIDYLKTQNISWEILPPGEKEKFIIRLFSGREIKPEVKKTAEERYDFFMKLKPKEMIIGLNSFQRYMGAKIEGDLVVFENSEYGNALYIMFKDWEDLSKKSRIDLLSGRYGKDFERVIHTGDWKEKTREIIKKYLKSK